MNVPEADKENSGTKLVDRIKIVGTPFTMVNYGENWYLMMGRYRLNETEYKTQEEVLQYMEDNQWDIILKMIAIIIENPVPKDTNK